MAEDSFVENLDELTIVADDDMLYVVDNSATGPDKDKRAPKGNLLAPIVADGDSEVVAIGGVVDAESTLKVYGQELIVHTAIDADDHALELDVDAAGHGDVKVIDIDYITGTLGAGEDEGVILINIDETQATGGDIFALEVLATDGKAGIYGLKAGVLIGPVHQDAGTFDDPTTATDNTASSDVDAMKDDSTSTTTAIFEADNEYIIIGAAAAFEEMEFVLTTQSSKNIKPTFWYSTSGTGQFTQFTPVDGTDGFKHTGVVAWDASDLSDHVADGVTGTFDIKIIRTRNKIPGNTPVLGYAKTASTTEYIWNKDGNVNINNLTTAGTITAKTITGDGDIVQNSVEPGSTGRVTLKSSASNVARILFGTSADEDAYMDIGAFDGFNNIDTQGRDFRLFSTNRNPIVHAKASTGNVGIGDAAPGEKLDVAGNINVTGVLKVDDVQIITNQVIDARCNDALNSGDATTDGVIDSLRDAMITHGLIAAA